MGIAIFKLTKNKLERRLNDSFRSNCPGRAEVFFELAMGSFALLVDVSWESGVACFNNQGGRPRRVNLQVQNNELKSDLECWGAVSYNLVGMKQKK